MVARQFLRLERAYYCHHIQCTVYRVYKKYVLYILDYILYTLHTVPVLLLYNITGVHDILYTVVVQQQYIDHILCDITNGCSAQQQFCLCACARACIKYICSSSDSTSKFSNILINICEDSYFFVLRFFFNGE